MTYLIAWIKSFLSKRQGWLIFQGSPKVCFPGAVGTSQGSPISPLPFVLHMGSLHPTLPQGLGISYVDDLTLRVGSDCVRSNIRGLQHLFSVIQRQSAYLGVAFSVPKVEHIRWSTPNDCSDESFAPIVIDDMSLAPFKAVRWLGYWLTPMIQSSIHFQRRMALPKASFPTICQLSAASQGLFF